MAQALIIKLAPQTPPLNAAALGTKVNIRILEKYFLTS